MDDLDPMCRLCNEREESVTHLFFACCVTGGIWREVREWLGIRRDMSTLRSALKWMKKEARGTGWRKKAMKMALATTVYVIWEARNKLVYEGVNPIPRDIVSSIKTSVYRIIFHLYPSLLES